MNFASAYPSLSLDPPASSSSVHGTNQSLIGIYVLFFLLFASTFLRAKFTYFNIIFLSFLPCVSRLLSLAVPLSVSVACVSLRTPRMLHYTLRFLQQQQRTKGYLAYLAGQTISHILKCSIINSAYGTYIFGE